MRRTAAVLAVTLAVGCGGGNSNPAGPSGNATTTTTTTTAGAASKLGTQQVNVTYCASGALDILDLFYPSQLPASGKFPVIAGVSSSFQWVINGTHGWETEPFGPIMPTWSEILQMELDFFDRHLKS